MRFRKIFHPRWLIVYAWLALIFFLSAQPGHDSSQSGKALIDFLRSIGLDPTLIFGQYTSYVIRKSAHFTEYFILTLLLNSALNSTETLRQKKWFAFGFAVFYACTDEIHQAFVPDRVGTPVDVLIDSAGAGLAIALISLVELRKRYRKISV